MRYLIYFIIVLFLFSQYSYAQEIEKLEETQSPTESYDFYMSKKKSNETTGWILIGSGAAMFIGGVLIANSQDEVNNFDDLAEEVGDALGGTILMIGGAGLAVASVPFFIIAGNNKNKAELALKGGTLSVNNMHIPNSKYLGLSVKIPIGN